MGMLCKMSYTFHPAIKSDTKMKYMRDESWIMLSLRQV